MHIKARIRRLSYDQIINEVVSIINDMLGNVNQ